MLLKLLNRSILAITIIVSLAILWLYGFHRTSLYGDALGYYSYLPSTFIYHNNGNPEKLPADKDIDFWVLMRASTSNAKTPTGYRIPVYTYGVALMEAPFFLIVHACEKITGRSANGFSDPYDRMLLICPFIYAILGLLIVYNILKKSFTETQSLYGVLLLFLGTNLFWFSLVQGGMAHVPLFFLYALLMLQTIKVHERPKVSTFLSIGLIAGLITIIRPVDVLCLVIPLFYTVYNRETLRQKIIFIKAHLVKILLLAAAFFIPILPQLIYWKVFTGSFFYYSYGDQSFHWDAPKIIEGLFFFNNGWLAYSPLMAFAIAGAFFYRRIKEWAWCTWLMLPLYIYIIYSWYCFTYINGFGSRPMIHLYPLLAIPLTAFISFIWQQKWYLKLTLSLVCIFCVAVNISNSLQQAKGLLVSEESNIVYHFQTLFQMHLSYNDLVVSDTREMQPDTAKITRTGVITCNNYDDSASDHFVRDTVFGSRYFYHMGSDDYAPPLKMTYSKKLFKDARWLKCSGNFMYPEGPDYFKHLMVVSSAGKLWEACKIENKIAFQVKGPQTGLEDFAANKWGYVWFFAKIPENMADGDIIQLLIWNTGKRELYIDDLCIELYK